MRLRDDYVADAASAVERWWNRTIARAGIEYAIHLPHVAFNRRIGEFAAINADPEGNILNAEEWQHRRGEFLTSPGDDAFVVSLMPPVTTPGAFASWIAAPPAGIGNKPGDLHYANFSQCAGEAVREKQNQFPQTRQRTPSGRTQ